MTKRSQNTTDRAKRLLHKSVGPLFLLALLGLWALASHFKWLPAFMLPSPGKVVQAFVKDFPLLMRHAGTSLLESLWGLLISVSLAFVLAVLMDGSKLIRRAISPLLVLTQTVPTIAIAPLLVLWLGYGIAPKVVLIVIVCFFPMAIGLLGGFGAVDADLCRLFVSMGASRRQILWRVKLPSAMPSFIAGLKIAVSYAIVGAVVAEWLGGNQGLGVYMTRVQKSYGFDKMFAVIILVSVISLVLIKLVELLEKRCTRWARVREENQN